MTTPAAALPALPPGADIRSITERVNALIRWFNRPDLLIPSYAADSGSGAAYTIAPSSDIKQYEVGQVYEFAAAHANTIGNPTLAVQGLPAGAIARINGTALSPGDMPAGPVTVICTSTTPTFALLTPYAAAATTTYLGADVALNNTASFFNGPNTGSLPPGNYLIIGKATVKDSAGAAGIGVQIHNGTSAIDTASGTTFGANTELTIALVAGVTLAAATTLTLQAKDPISTSGVLLTTGAAAGASNRATSITAVRLS
jgi:hypothetical protein